jgi:hypothetical protein
VSARLCKRDLLRIEVLLLMPGLIVAGFAVFFLFDPDTQVAGASLLGAVVAAAGTWRTIHVTRDGQITDRFSKAIGQLGSEADEDRLGGIYALERIARDSRRDHEAVIEVLAAYVRKRAPWPPETARRYGTRSRPENDVQAVLAVLGRREVCYDRHNVDLKSTDLRGALFGGAKLRRVDFTNAHLEGANFEDADLRGAILENADLRGADLSGAKGLEASQLAESRMGSTTKLPRTSVP